MPEQFLREMRITIRGLIRRRSFTVVVLLTLIAGIAACTTVFTVVHSVLLRPLPYRNPDRIAVVPSINQDATGKEQRYGASVSDYLDWRERSRSFAGLIALFPTEVAVTGSGEPEQLDAGIISANFFDVLGVSPALGRSFGPEEEVANAKVVMISHGLWQRRFGGVPDVLGKTMIVDGISREVIGVAPADFFYAIPSELWLPLDLSFPRNPRNPNRNTSVAGRLRAGVSFEQASREIQTIAAQLASEFAVNAGWGAKVLPIREPFVEDIKEVLLFLSAAVAFLLIIVCVNVANLVLIRHMERRTEMMLRLTLGASRGDLWRRSLYENFCLTSVSAVIGLLVAQLSLKPLILLSPVLGTSPAGSRILASVSLDSRVVLFTFVLASLVAVALSILPFLRLPEKHLSDSLKSGSKGAAGLLDGRRFQNIFVVAQLSISFLLLMAAMLTFQNFQKLKKVDPGFKIDSLITMRLSLPQTRYDTHEKRVEFQKRFLEAAHGIPGVSSASTTTRLPLNEFGMSTVFDVDGIPPVPGGFVSNFRRIGPDYFQTMQTRILEGRDFNALDYDKAMPVAIVSRQMANRFWPGQSAIGKRVQRLAPSDRQWRTIVGVVADMKDTSLNIDNEITLYIPYYQGSIPAFYVAIRSSQQPEGVVAALRNEVRKLDPDLPLYQIVTAAQLFSDALSRSRFAAFLLGIFASLGIFIALVGVYGVVSYSTARRVNEIGIRMAIGAPQRSILQLILEQSVRMSLWGILFGLVASLITERIVTTMWSDPGTIHLYLGISFLLVFIGLLASIIPAVRAIRLDPVTALRYE